MADILIINGIVVTMDGTRRVIEDGAVAITADRINDIGSTADQYAIEAFKEAAGREPGEKKFHIVTKKPIVPSEPEMRSNPRARSAKLRVLERSA